VAKTSLISLPPSTGVELSLRLSGIKDSFDDLWEGYTTAVDVVTSNPEKGSNTRPGDSRVRTWFETSGKSPLYSWVLKKSTFKSDPKRYVLKLFNVVRDLQFDERVWDEDKDAWGKSGKKGAVGGVWSEWIGDNDAINEGIETIPNVAQETGEWGRVLTSSDSYIPGTPQSFAYGRSCLVSSLPSTVSSYPTEFIVFNFEPLNQPSNVPSSTYTVFEVGLEKWAFTSQQAVFNIVHMSPGVHLARCYVYDNSKGKDNILPVYISKQIKITIQSPTYYQSTVSPSDIVTKKVSPWMSVIGGVGMNLDEDDHYFGSVTANPNAMVRCGFTSTKTHTIYNGVETTVERMGEGEGSGKLKAICGKYNEVGRWERELRKTGENGMGEDGSDKEINAVVMGIEHNGWILPTGSWGGGRGYIDSSKLVTEGEEWVNNAKSTSEWGMEKIIAIQQGLGENTKNQFGGKFGQIIGPEIGASIDGHGIKGAGVPVYYYFPFITGREWIVDPPDKVKGNVGLQMIVTLPECEGAEGKATKKGKDKNNQDKASMKPARTKGNIIDLKPNDCGGVSGDKIVNLSTDRGKVILYNVPDGVTGIRFRLVDGVGDPILFKTSGLSSWTDVLATTHFHFKNATMGIDQKPKRGADKRSIFDLLKEGVDLATLELLIAREPERARERDGRGKSIVQAAREMGREDIVEFFIEEGLEE